MTGQARTRRLRVAEAASASDPYVIDVSERTATRLLERYCLAQGARQVAEAAVERANTLARSYDEHLREVADAPPEAALRIDFVARRITVTPAVPGESEPGP